MRALRQNGIAQSIVACYIVVSSHTRFTTNSPRPTHPTAQIFLRKSAEDASGSDAGGAHALCVPTEKPPVTDARRAGELRVEHTTPPDLSLDP